MASYYIKSELNKFTDSYMSVYWSGTEWTKDKLELYNEKAPEIWK